MLPTFLAQHRLHLERASYLHLKKKNCCVILSTIRTNCQWSHLYRPIDLLWSQSTSCLCSKISVWESQTNLLRHLLRVYLLEEICPYVSLLLSVAISNIIFFSVSYFLFCLRMWNLNNLNQRTHILEPWIARFQTAHLVHPIISIHYSDNPKLISKLPQVASYIFKYVPHQNISTTNVIMLWWGPKIGQNFLFALFCQQCD